jgi:hypothetical protein
MNVQFYRSVAKGSECEERERQTDRQDTHRLYPGIVRFTQRTTGDLFLKVTEIGA